MAGASNICGRQPSEAEALADTTVILGRSSSDDSSDAEAVAESTGIVGRSSSDDSKAERTKGPRQPGQHSCLGGCCTQQCCSSGGAGKNGQCERHEASPSSVQ